MENNKKEKRDLLKEQEDRILPIAQKIIEIMASKKLAMGSQERLSEQERLDCYMPIYQEIIELFKEKNILLDEIASTFQFILQAFQFTRDITEMSIGRNIERANNYLWKKEKHEISIKDLDSVLVESEKK